MTHTYEELKKKTVAELREIAAGIEHEAVQGHTQMHKNELLPALCKALGLDMHEHHHVTAENKTEIKAKIWEFKKQREAFLTAHDHAGLKAIRRQIHHLKRQIRRATV